MVRVMCSAIAIITAVVLADHIGGPASPLLLLGSAGLLAAVYLVWTTTPKKRD